MRLRGTINTVSWGTSILLEPDTPAITSDRDILRIGAVAEPLIYTKFVVACLDIVEHFLRMSWSSAQRQVSMFHLRRRRINLRSSSPSALKAPTTSFGSTTPTSTPLPPEPARTMDPLSVTASIVAVLQLTSELASYISDARNATTEQQEVAIKAGNLYGILTRLRFRVEEAEKSQSDDPWFNQVKLLAILKMAR